MRKKFYQTEKFKELEKEWYQKLKDSGFSDAEASPTHLKQRATNCYRTTNHLHIESKRRYYELLGINFHRESFNNEVDKIVMERRANGIKIKLISEELRGQNQKCHRQTIRSIIHRYETKWKIKRAN